MTNVNLTHKKIKIKLKLSNACYYLVQKLKNQNIRKYNAVCSFEWM
jgi:hypothetical protein